MKKDSGIETEDFLEAIESRDASVGTDEAVKYLNLEEDDKIQSDLDELGRYHETTSVGEDERFSSIDETICLSEGVTRNKASCNTDEDVMVLRKSRFSAIIEEIAALRIKLSMAEKRQDLVKSRLDVKKRGVASSTNDLGYRVIPDDEYSQLMQEYSEMRHLLKDVEWRKFFKASTLTSDVAPTLNNVSEEIRGEFEDTVDTSDYLETDLKSLKLEVGESNSADVHFPQINNALELKFLERQQLLLEKLDIPRLGLRSQRDEEILSDDEFGDVLSRIDELKQKVTGLEEAKAETAKISPRSDDETLEDFTEQPQKRILAITILNIFTVGSIAYWLYKYCRT